MPKKLPRHCIVQLQIVTSTNWGNQCSQCSRLESSMPFKRDLALQNRPLSKHPFKTQPQIENEDVT